MVEHTPENVTKLAEAVVDSWDMDTLLMYAKDRLEQYYGRDTSSFQEDWELTMQEGE